MNWTCATIEQRLSDYIEGALHPTDQRAFDAHVNTCADCTGLVSRVSRLLTKMHTMEDFDPPPRLVNTILEQTLGPRKTAKGWSGAMQWIRGFSSPRLAYGALTVGVTIMVLLTTSGFSWRKPKLADLSPASVVRNTDRQLHLVYARSTKFVSDLRVVYEIQSRLREDNSIPPGEQNPVPQVAPPKDPGRTDGSQPGSPKQQNRANDVGYGANFLSASRVSHSLDAAGAFAGSLAWFPGGRSLR
ncbi:MAG TPA: zf-HC2 domain-containing protein [Candidatus Acidoferrum sp.]|nr:zf-HC2 domain-containing protein [Candidatus Acidoferrum sp.]